uniref:Uncharacterized protein n=1 Tax=Romanomermis culicivorax TaxID=13658 RepID=A0A915JVZ3_ROMCU
MPAVYTSRATNPAEAECNSFKPAMTEEEKWRKNNKKQKIRDLYIRLLKVNTVSTIDNLINF